MSSEAHTSTPRTDTRLGMVNLDMENILREALSEVMLAWFTRQGAKERCDDRAVFCRIGRCMIVMCMYILPFGIQNSRLVTISGDTCKEDEHPLRSPRQILQRIKTCYYLFHFIEATCSSYACGCCYTSTPWRGCWGQGWVSVGVEWVAVGCPSPNLA